MGDSSTDLVAADDYRGWEESREDLAATEALVERAGESLPMRDSQEADRLNDVLQTGTTLRLRWKEIADTEAVVVPRRNERRELVPGVTSRYYLARVRAVHSHVRRNWVFVLMRAAEDTFMVDAIARSGLRKLRHTMDIDEHVFQHLTGLSTVPVLPQKFSRAVARELRDVAIELNGRANRHLALPGDAPKALVQGPQPDPAPRPTTPSPEL